jgi:hypothetical protein
MFAANHNTSAVGNCGFFTEALKSTVKLEIEFVLQVRPICLFQHILTRNPSQIMRKIMKISFSSIRILRYRFLLVLVAVIPVISLLTGCSAAAPAAAAPAS